MSNNFKFIISILLPMIIGGISGSFTSASINTWYVTLNKPWFNPPNWIFAPVWTLLYLIMGIAFYIIWKSEAVNAVKQTAVILFAAQLLANFLWSLIFFYLKQPGWAMLDIILMWILIVATIFSFGKISSTAAWLMLPYICWVSFAMILNFYLWKLNA